MNRPIGIFDSGVGGISVWLELQKLLPSEDYIYYADSGNCPYGEKEGKEIIKLSKAITHFLITQNCKAIIIACNTATAAAIQVLRKLFDIPFIGMEPAIKPAAQTTKTGVIGVLATHGTFKGNHFKTTAAKYANDIRTITQPGIGLVELVEKNQTNTDKAKKLLQKHLSPMIESNADKIVLGCTHYPFLIDSIKHIIPEHIDIINPAPAIAQRTKHILEENKLFTGKKSKGESHFYTSGNTEILKQLLDKNSHEEFIIRKISL